MLAHSKTKGGPLLEKQEVEASNTSIHPEKAGFPPLGCQLGRESPFCWDLDSEKPLQPCLARFGLAAVAMFPEAIPQCTDDTRGAVSVEATLLRVISQAVDADAPQQSSASCVRDRRRPLGEWQARWMLEGCRVDGLMGDGVNVCEAMVACPAFGLWHVCACVCGFMLLSPLPTMRIR